MRKILIIGLVLLLIFLIYLTNMDKKVYYVALGDSLEKVYAYNEEVYGYSYYVKNYLKKKDLLERYSDDFSRVDTRSTDIIRDIKNNKKITTSRGTFSMKNALIKADLLTVNISYSDLFNKFNNTIYTEIYDYIDTLAYDLDRLFELIREYCKEDIVFIGPYNLFKDENVLDALEYLNNKYRDVCLEYDVIYVDISDLQVIDGKNLEEIGNRVIDKMSKSLFETWFLIICLLEYTCIKFLWLILVMAEGEDKYEKRYSPRIYGY